MHVRNRLELLQLSKPTIIHHKNRTIYKAAVLTCTLCSFHFTIVKQMGETFHLKRDYKMNTRHFEKELTKATAS